MFAIRAATPAMANLPRPQAVSRDTKAASFVSFSSNITLELRCHCENRLEDSRHKLYFELYARLADQTDKNDEMESCRMHLECPQPQTSLSTRSSPTNADAVSLTVCSHNDTYS